MNLGHTNIQQVKASKPVVSRAQSFVSNSVSDEYFTDYASDASSTKTRVTIQYDTPPSHISTPTVHHRMPDSEMTLPARPAAARPPPLDIRANRATAAPDVRRSEYLGFDDMSPPTPGLDDTPYIRFAIEQLTRDEELLGRDRHGSITSTDYPILQPAPTQPVDNRQPAPISSEPPRRPPDQQPTRQPSNPVPVETKRIVDGIFLPVSDSSGRQWSDLGFVPTVLRLPFLLLLVFVCLLFVAGIIFSNVHATKSHGLDDYDGTGTARYFVFQFLPQLLGILLVLWIFVVQAAIYRVLPYFILSADRQRDRVLQDLPILPANFVLPDFTHFRCGEPLVGTVMLIFWLFNFTVPLLSCFYQTRWISNDGPARWRWSTVQGVGWCLIVLYILLIAALLYCVSRFRRRTSSLRWDPTSLADLMSLFQTSNILGDFYRSEISASIHTRIPPRFLRLGYWTTSKSPDIFYAVGEEGAALEKATTDTTQLLQEKPTRSRRSNSVDIERQRSSSTSAFTRNIHSPFVRYRWTPWFLRDSAVIAWIVIAIILLLAFLVVSYLHHAVQFGFLPLLPSPTNAAGFSPSDFLYSFLPALLGMFLFLAWQPIDTFFRASQPFANLSRPSGASAEHSLLLAYSSCWPGVAPIHALINGDLKLAWITFITLLSATLPVLAGGVFTAQLFIKSNTVRIAASMPGYIALSVFLAIYALSYLVIWPTRKRYLPHDIHSLAALLSFVYQSPLMREKGLRDVVSKADLVGRLVSMTGDRAREPRYAFGIYVGRDGTEHLGIDRLQRPGSKEMLVSRRR